MLLTMHCNCAAWSPTYIEFYYVCKWHDDGTANISCIIPHARGTLCWNGLWDISPVVDLMTIRHQITDFLVSPPVHYMMSRPIRWCHSVVGSSESVRKQFVTTDFWFYDDSAIFRSLMWNACIRIDKTAHFNFYCLTSFISLQICQERIFMSTEMDWWVGRKDCLISQECIEPPWVIPNFMKNGEICQNLK